MGTVSVAGTVTDRQGNIGPWAASCTVSASDPAPFDRVGLSSSRQGLNAGETHKRQAWLDRTAEMATQLGIAPAAMRAMCGRHVYDTTNNPVSDAMNIGVFANCVNDGAGVVMLTSSQWNDLAGVAAGSYDNTIRACAASLAASGRKVIWNVKHEPQNNGFTASQKAQWRQTQARVAAIIYDQGSPNLHYTDCHIPGTSDSVDWDWLPELKILRPNDWPAINARTYLGMDPYPEVGVVGSLARMVRAVRRLVSRKAQGIGANDPGHTVQTLQKKIGAGVTFHRGKGRTGPICLPEVALFNWCIGHSTTYTLTASQQAQRLHDELWTYLNSISPAGCAYFYYDVADLDDADVRDSTRILDSPPELLEYAKLARRDYS